jgi:hypothetical protein
MSTVLGRPMRVRLQDMEITPPIDSPPLQDRAQIGPLPRNDFDPPTPLTIHIFNHKIAVFLIRTATVDHSSPASERDNEIQKLHEEILDFREHLPSYLWIKNPDRSFDNRPECWWLTEARNSVEAAIWFTVLALHRPQIFKTPKNRNLAMKAGLHTLRAQKITPADIPLRKCWSFSYLFSTFDAAVTVAAIYILYPKDSPRHLEEATTHIRTVITQFKRMSHVNSLTKTAAAVLQAMLIRLEKATTNPKISEAGSNRDTRLPLGADSSLSDRLHRLDDVYLNRAHSSTGQAPWAYDFETISPPLPLCNLLYDGLSCLNTTTTPITLFPEEQTYDPNIDCQFQGHFDNDAFWNIMNQIELG